MSFRIAGTGMYVPENIVTNDDLSKLVETNDEWIRTRVGIERRHISVDETTADMAVKAAEAALENSGIKPEELDLILVSTVSGDYIVLQLPVSFSKHSAYIVLLMTSAQLARHSCFSLKRRQVISLAEQ